MKTALALTLLLITPLAAAQSCLEASWRQGACPNLVYTATPEEPTQKMVCVCISDFDYLQNYASVEKFAEQNLLQKELERLSATYQLRQQTLRRLLALPEADTSKDAAH
ncbi:hypothetical protein [uncultured Ferrimonas sp.]|uniref:hypothetical protein n=1 Tax=uncultured Ferrimonas sp. TaxID=432640 RepID=UPI0026060CA3|nr:hypothetical protein [uncultured Ferrimonas sp.]